MITNVLSYPLQNFKGYCLEIGSQCNPFKYNSEMTVTYADKYTYQQIFDEIKTHPELDPKKLVKHTIKINDICEMPSVKDNSFDYVMHSHVIEHTRNPIKAIQECIRITNKYVYMLIPDMRFTFDKNRKLTELSHLIEDYKINTPEVEYKHYEEAGLPFSDWVAQRNFHIHTFTEQSVKELLEYTSKKFNFKILDIVREDIHIACLLEKL